MTDISELRDGDVIEVIMRFTLDGTARPVCVSKDRGRQFYLDQLVKLIESFTVIRPEIVPGKPYVDANGKLYIGRSRGCLVRTDDAGDQLWYANHGDYEPLPAGLRPAKVVAE
jgi:hypothetical protein